MRLVYQGYDDFPELPGSYMAGLKMLSGLSEESMTELQNAFKSSEASLRSKLLIAQVSSKVSETLAEQVRPIINTLVGLYSLRAFLGLSVSDFIRQLERASDESEEDEESESNALTQEERSQIGERLLVLLNLGGALGVTSKALDVLTEHDKIFRKGRVMTDIRPIFQPDPAARPAAAVVIHTLKVEYRHAYEPKSFFVAMDTTDVKALREVLERAEQKATSLEIMLASSNIPYLGVEE